MSAGKAGGIRGKLAIILADMGVAEQAPAANTSAVLATCSATVFGTAGLQALVGSDPVMAMQMMQGVMV